MKTKIYITQLALDMNEKNIDGELKNAKGSEI